MNEIMKQRGYWVECFEPFFSGLNSEKELREHSKLLIDKIVKKFNEDEEK